MLKIKDLVSGYGSVQILNGANMKDGLLTISCEKIIPEIKKKRLIEIK